MARKRGVFQRFLELVLDKRSAQKTEKDTQDALKRATDPRAVARNISSIAKGVAGSLAAIGGAVAAATVGLMKMAQRGQEVAGVQAAFARVTGDAEGALALLRKATRGLISDYDLMVGLNKSVSLGASKNAEDFAALASTAQQLGRALGIDAAYALESLNTGIARSSRLYLDNIGIIIDVDEANREYAKAIGQTVSALTAADRKEAFRIAALREAKELTDQLGTSQDRAAEAAARFGATVANIKDGFAQLIAQSPMVQNYFEDLNALLRDWTSEGGIELVVTAEGLPGTGDVEKDLRLLRERFRLADEQIAIQKRKMAQAEEEAGFYRGPKFHAQRRAMEEQLELMEREAALIGRRITILSGLPPDKPEEEATEPVDPEVVRKAQDDRLKFLAQAVDLGILQKKEQLELWQIYLDSNAALHAGNLSLEERIRLTERGRTALEAAGGVVGVRKVKAPRDQMDLLPFGMTLTPQSPEFQGFSEGALFLIDNFAEVQSAGVTAALGIQSAFEDAFSALGQEGNAFADSFQAIFAGAAVGALSALAQLSAAKVVENVANAIEQVALASGDAAIGNLKGAALHSKSAKEHVLAAAKWSVVGGVAGAAAAAVSSMGGGASTFRGTDAVGRRIDQLDRRGGDINIYLDGVDPSNPRHQAKIGETARQYQQRYGGSVNVFPRNR